MKDANRISKAQHSFLRAVRDGSDTLAVLKRQAQITETRFARWMRNRFFVRALKGVLTGLARQRFVVIELGAHAGSRRLEEGVAGEKVHSRERVEVCRVLVELAERQRFGRPRSRRAKKKTLDPERDLCHPNAKHVEKELIAMVKGER